MNQFMPLDVISLDLGRPCYRPYYRVSHEKSLAGTGWERQRGKDETSDEAIAAKLGLPLGLPLDGGRRAVSGFRGKNVKEGVLADFIRQAMLGLVPAGTVIGIDEWSRLTRMPLRRAKRLLLDLMDNGIGVYVKKHHTLTNAATVDDEGSGFVSHFMAEMQLKLAHDASVDKARYTRKAVEARHQDAQENGVAPTRGGPAWLGVTTDLSYKEAKAQGVKREYYPLPNPTHVILTIFPMALTTGILTIANWLNEQWVAGDTRFAPFGANRKNGSAGWYPASVGALLQNPAVYGLVVRTRVDEITGVTSIRQGDEYLGYPEVISKELFDRVQAEIGRRRKVDPDALGRRAGKGGRKGHMVPNLFSGLCICAVCSGPVTLFTTRPGKGKNRAPRIKTVFTYLRCRTAKIGGGCPAKALAYEPVERAILDTLGDMPLAALTPAQDAVSVAQQEQNTLTTRLSMLTAKVDQMDDQDDPDVILAMMPKVKKWGAEIRTINARMEELRPIIDRENGEGGAGERLLTVKKLRATAMTAEGAERLGARRTIMSALAGVLERVVVQRDQKKVFAVLRGGHGVISVMDGVATSHFTQSAFTQGMKAYFAENAPDRLEEHDDVAQRLGIPPQALPLD